MKDMMTNENLLMDYNRLRWVAQSNYNSLNNGKVETHMADHLFVGAACEESKPKLWGNKLRPSWPFSSCWGNCFWMDPGFRTQNKELLFCHLLPRPTTMWRRGGYNCSKLIPQHRLYLSSCADHNLFLSLSSCSRINIHCYWIISCISCISSRPFPPPRSQSTWLVVSVTLSHRSRLISCSQSLCLYNWENDAFVLLNALYVIEPWFDVVVSSSPPP